MIDKKEKGKLPAYGDIVLLRANDQLLKIKGTATLNRSNNI